MYNEPIIDGALNEKHPQKTTKRGKIIFFALLSLLVTLLIITTITYAYGFALYIGIPLTLGFIFGFKETISFQFAKSASYVLFIVMVLSGLLILLKLEGAICIIMIAFPLFLFVFVGYGLGYFIYKNNLQKNKTIVSLLLLINPTFCAIDCQLEMFNQEIKSEIVIHTSKEKIWNTLANTVQYNQHPNLLFKYGVNYPKSMQCIQQNDSLLLRCNLRNGNIDLYINQFIKDSLMQFQITKPVVPIKELTIYNDFNAPHTHEDFFKLHYGQFQIQTIDKNNCKLIATSNLSYKFAPNWYWKWWCTYLMNKMHQHVLVVIKQNTEQNNWKQLNGN